MGAGESSGPAALGAGWTHVVPRPRPGLFGRAARALGTTRAVEPADLEPRGVGALLDTALDVLRARFLACFGLAFAIFLPLALLSRALRHRTGESVGALFFELGLTFLVQALVVGLVTHLVYAHLQGRRASALESLAVAGRRGPALLAVAFLSQVGTSLGTMCCLLPGLVVAWLTAAAPAALVLEGLGPIAAIARSTRLVRDAFGRWLGVIVLQFLLVLPLNAAAGVLDEASAFGGPLDGTGLVLAATVVRVALMALGMCVLAVVLTVLYIDCRVRTEGFDLVMRFERLRAARGGEA